MRPMKVNVDSVILEPVASQTKLAASGYLAMIHFLYNALLYFKHDGTFLILFIKSQSMKGAVDSKNGYVAICPFIVPLKSLQ